MDKETIVRKLIHTYPDSIAIYPGRGDIVSVDFVETCENFAENIMQDFDANRQQNVFGRIFETGDECAKYLASFMRELYDQCTEFANENYYTSYDGDIYSEYDEEEDCEEDDKF